MALVLLVLCTLYIISRSAYRADREARLIQDSTVALGFWWHVEMWLTGKAGTGVICVVFYGLATDVYGAVAMGVYSMGLYWLCFDLFLNKERGKRTWYISTAKETALSDRLLYWIRQKTGMTEPETHLAVKVPLILIGVIACILAALCSY